MMELAPLAARAEAIVTELAEHGSVLVAFSGGVDSALVAVLAHRALGERALAATAQAETLAAAELEHARWLAAEIGIAHLVVPLSELADPDYAANPAWRCYLCQGRRMGTLARVARERGYALVVDGTNASDPGPDRAGLAAVREAGVASPLLDHGLSKEDVRELAHRLGLSVWERPANACLSSRIPHGQVITLGKLQEVEQAEALVFAHGFRQVRVRHDRGVARVEVEPAAVPRLKTLWSELEPALLALGFGAAALVEEGYRRGGADARTP